MKIIEMGKIPEENVYTARCTNCSTKFEFKKKEATYRKEVTYRMDQRDGDYLEIGCPLCNKKVYVDIYTGNSAGY